MGGHRVRVPARNHSRWVFTTEGHGRTPDVLVVAEVAATAVLRAGASLLLRSFWRLQHVDPGLDADRVLMARLSLPGTRYPTAAKSAKFFRTLIDRLDGSPEVETAAATSCVPVGGGGFGLGRSFLAEGRPEPPAGSAVSAQWTVVTPDYFRTIGVPFPKALQ